MIKFHPDEEFELVPCNIQIEKTSKSGREVTNKAGNRQERRCEELSSGYTKKKLRDHKAVRIFFGCFHLADQGAVNRKMSSGCWDHPLRDWMRQDSQDICKGIFFLQRDVMDMQCLLQGSKKKDDQPECTNSKGSSSDLLPSCLHASPLTDATHGLWCFEIGQTNLTSDGSSFLPITCEVNTLIHYLVRRPIHLTPNKHFLRNNTHLR